MDKPELSEKDKEKKARKAASDRAHQQKPEVKARRAAQQRVHRQKPEVKARNAAGSAQSPGSWFHVAAADVPAVPTLRQPVGTTTDNQPGYRWDHVGGAIEYQQLVVGADSVQYVNTWY